MLLSSMELVIRPVGLFSRLLRRPALFRNLVGTAAVEENNSELLNSFNKDLKNGGVVPVFRRALLFPTRVAVQDELGIYTYAGLHQTANELSLEISAELLGETERSIVYMCGNNASHVITQWAIWMSGNIAIPLTPIHPPEMLKYFVQDSTAKLILCSEEYEKILRPIADETKVQLLVTGRDKEITAQLHETNSSNLKVKENGITDSGKSNLWYADKEAMLIYTSGTTSKPKGVVWTHSMLQTHISSLQCAWRCTARDVVLHALPLHHIHGQLNALLTPLATGARIRMLPSFAAHAVWARLLGMGERDETKVSVFHGVPAQYARLASAHGEMFSGRTATRVRDTLEQRMRLMCAGSAPLPEALFRQWEEISGIRLLERYGMTEAGMALSNPYRPIEDRKVGRVGLPLPGIAARISREGKPLVTVDTEGPDVQISLHRLGLSKEPEQDQPESSWEPSTVTEHEEPTDGVYEGELLLKGPGVFDRYWNRSTSIDSPDFDGEWFKTGDTASFDGNTFRILGRTSIDIIKTGGYKVSALQVESAILDHPNVADVAVLGIEHETYGEIVGTVIVLKEKSKLTLAELKEFTGKKLAPYQQPRTMIVVGTMPRNVMGKLDKKVIRTKYGKDLVLKKN